MTAKPAYAAFVWALLFATVSLYWAAGGHEGLETLGVATERDLLAREVGAVTLMWTVTAFKLWVAGLALGLALGRLRQPAAFWAALLAGAVMAVYGASEVIEKLLLELDITAPPASLGASRVDTYLLLWDPLWMTGGVLLILAALGTRVPAAAGPTSPASS